MAVVRLQAAENLDWDDACSRASVLLDQNSEAFRKAVESRSQALYRSRHMSELNSARKSIQDETWLKATDWVRTMEDNFHVPCSICGKPMSFSSRDNNWEVEKKTLFQAFATWYHTTCKKAT
jgi:hypothetical protein